MLKILSILGLVAATAWAFAKPDYNSILAVITTSAALITSFLVKKTSPHQSQTVGDNSIGIQAGKNVKTGGIHKESGDS
ncbi:hypothetical protein [Pseudomonas viridiflava]|uniref:hypothetical protein n=1 Tax=Pseudomonas viridiflava TaxID=33069 RepID=UPI0013CEFD66|nr:hypothetical protein [Pseudomonas viridiflava]